LIKKIIITGPESVGKSTLCKQLAEHYGTPWLPEYARTYIEQLHRPYTYEDVVHIAKNQIRQLESSYTGAGRFVFFDTGLIITKVWFEVVYNTVPVFLIEKIKHLRPDFCLLLQPDIEWVADSVRENSGDARQILFSKYEANLIEFEYTYEKISGFGKIRQENAIHALESARCLQVEQ